MSTTPAMAELARARKELSAWLYKGVTGSRVHERVTQLVDDHQSAVKDAHAHKLAEQIREAGSHLGHNTNLAYRRVADLIDPEVQQ